MPASLKIVVPGADFSGLGNPKVIDLVEGFPRDDLQGLYLFEDQTVGAAYSGSVIDSSGLANHGTLLASSNITRITAGVKTGDAANNGFAFRTPVPVSGSFSGVVVTRNRIAAGTAGALPILHYSSKQSADSAIAVTSAQGGVTTSGRLMLNHDGSQVAYTYPEAGLANSKAGGGAWTGAVVTRVRVENTGQPKDSWMAVAWSFNAVTGEVILRGLGSTVTFTDKTAADAWLAAQAGGVHTFGFVRFTTASVVMGEIGLEAVYDTAKSVAELDVLIASAKARMTERGVTAL